MYRSQSDQARTLALQAQSCQGSQLKMAVHNLNGMALGVILEPMQSLAVRRKLTVAAPLCQLDHFQAGSVQRLQRFCLCRRVHAEKGTNCHFMSQVGKLP